MKQWNGLLKKEWYLMKEWFYGPIVGVILLVLLLPYGLSAFFKGAYATETLFATGMVWMVTSVVMPTIILLISIGKEMQRPDTWFHSTASMRKIMGVKMVFAALIGLLNLLVAILIAFNFVDTKELTLTQVSQISSMLLLSLFAASILFMGTCLLFGVIYQVIKPIVKGLSWPIIVFLFIGTTWFTAKITETDFYGEIEGFGPKIGFNIEQVTLKEGGLYMKLDALYFNTGAVLMDLVVTILIFFIATTLLEKKVRV